MSQVWAVHVTTLGSEPNDVEQVGPIETVYSTEEGAMSEAQARSASSGVVAASVTRYTLDAYGSRQRLALFVSGYRQELPHFTDCNGASGRRFVKH